MNFAMTTPTRNQGFARGGGASPAIVTPPEPVTATVHANRIVAVTLPFNTPRAASIRQYFQYRVLTELNERMFVYRRETDNKWTTIHRDSTPAVPRLTVQPDVAARALSVKVAACPDVSTVTLYDEAGNVVTAEDVSNMQFADLASQAQEAVPVEDAEATPAALQAVLVQVVPDLTAKIEESQGVLMRELVQRFTALTTKVEYLIDVVETNVRSADPFNRRAVVAVGDNASADHSDINSAIEVVEEAAIATPAAALAGRSTVRRTIGTASLAADANLPATVESTRRVSRRTA